MRLLNLLFCLTLCSVLCILPCYASEFDPFPSNERNDLIYEYDEHFYPRNINVSGRYDAGGGNVITVTDPLFYSSDGSISRDIDVPGLGSTTFSSYTWVFDGSSIPVSRVTFDLNLFELFLNLEQSFFTDLDCYFLINIFGSNAQNRFMYPVATLENVLSDYSYNYPDSNGYTFDSIPIHISVLGSTQYSASSVTYILYLSYHGDNIYLPSRGLTDSSGNDINPIVSINLATEDPDYFPNPNIPPARLPYNFVDSLIDIDIGVLDIRYGKKYLFVPGMDPIIDLWGDLPDLPDVVYPDDLGTVSTFSIFRGISELDIFIYLITPISLAGISFFFYRVIMWKSV